MRSCKINGLSMPMRIAQYMPSEIACAHVISNVSDFHKVNRSLDQPFIIHSLAGLCSGGRKSSGGDLNL